jgi:hypothetical protein
MTETPIGGMEIPTTADLVDHALKTAAWQNQYFDLVYDAPPDALAEDLISYDASLEEKEPAELIPLIIAWREKNLKPTICDECGEKIPVVEGGNLANKHHGLRCSLHDFDND